MKPTAKTVEDLFLADDAREFGAEEFADEIDRCSSHEEVTALCRAWLAFFEGAMEGRRGTSGVARGLSDDELLLSCTQCGGTGPMNESGCWSFRSDGSLVCPDCRRADTSLS